MDAVDGHQRTPLIAICRITPPKQTTNAQMAQRCETVRLLIEAKASLTAMDNGERTPMLAAIFAGNSINVTQLLDAGLRIEESYGQRTALHAAAEAGHEAVVQLLLQRKASVTATDKLRKTPLHIAAQCGNLAAVQLLVQAGASVAAKDKDGKTPRDWAAARKREAVVQLLDKLKFSA